MIDATVRDALADAAARRVLVVGESDAGKTTLIEQLLADWPAAGPVALVDCDVGQSRLGPPTTIGWGVIERPFPGWAQVPVRGMAFTGTVSPDGPIEPLLAQVERIVRDAGRAAPSLLVDTTGYVHGPAAARLKARKAAIVRPDLIIAMARGAELDALLGELGDCRIVRIRASPDATRRDLAQRAVYRSRQFARYFANAARQAVALRDVAVIGAGPDWPAGKTVERSLLVLLDRVVSLRSAAGEDLALGLLRDLDAERRHALILTPLKDVSPVATLVVGSIRWPEPAPEA